MKSSSTLFLFTIISSVLYLSANAVPENNVCAKSKLTIADGTQNKNGECVKTEMGEIPNTNNMASTVIRFPKNGDIVTENTAFTIRTVTTGLDTGFFSDADTQYYTFPQKLNAQGLIQGHSHVTVQKIVDENNPPNPKFFDFFKGINEPANAQGELTALVDKGLAAGNYRLCTIVSSFSHQPLLMPVAQRGGQDDCSRFTVVPKGQGKGNGGNGKGLGKGKAVGNIRRRADFYSRKTNDYGYY